MFVRAIIEKHALIKISIPNFMSIITLNRHTLYAKLLLRKNQSRIYAGLNRTAGKLFFDLQIRTDIIILESF